MRGRPDLLTAGAGGATPLRCNGAGRDPEKAASYNLVRRVMHEPRPCAESGNRSCQGVRTRWFARICVGGDGRAARGVRRLSATGKDRRQLAQIARPSLTRPSSVLSRVQAWRRSRVASQRRCLKSGDGLDSAPRVGVGSPRLPERLPLGVLAWASLPARSEESRRQNFICLLRRGWYF
jgi:hypothetical protein